MTVSVDLVHLEFSCDGSTKSFELTDLYFFQSSDLTVWSIDGEIATELVQGSDYSITGTGTSGAAVLETLSDTALASGLKLYVMRTTADLQQQNYVEGDSFPADDTERAFDRRTMVAQELNYLLSRCLRSSLYQNEMNPLPGPTNLAGKILTFDADGQPEAEILKARLALAPDGDNGPSFPETSERTNRLLYVGADGNFTRVPALSETGLLTIGTDGKPTVMTAASYFGTKSQDFNGGYDGLTDGDTFDGGFDG